MESESVSGLVGGYGCTCDSRVELKEPVAPEGFEGEWLCCKLGCGGWGCTYKCEQSGRVVVFKVPRGFESIIEGGLAPTVPERLVKRIIERAEVLRKLDHPNILRILGVSKAAPLLVYEYANQGSLEWQIAKGWRPSLKDVLLVALQVGDALRYIHSRGLVHGDVKAGNVFFANGVTKLGDFSGLIKLLSMTSCHSRLSYTPGWRAPEQVYSDLRRKAKQLGYENKMDIYMLGNLILYMLTGETVDGEDAIQEESLRETIEKIEYPELRKLIYEMMKLDPLERSSAEEVVRKLTIIYQQENRKNKHDNQSS